MLTKNASNVIGAISRYQAMHKEAGVGSWLLKQFQQGGGGLRTKIGDLIRKAPGGRHFQQGGGGLRTMIGNQLRTRPKRSAAALLAAGGVGGSTLTALLSSAEEGDPEAIKALQALQDQPGLREYDTVVADKDKAEAASSLGDYALYGGGGGILGATAGALIDSKNRLRGGAIGLGTGIGAGVLAKYLKDKYTA